MAAAALWNTVGLLQPPLVISVALPAPVQCRGVFVATCLDLSEIPSGFPARGFPSCLA